MQSESQTLKAVAPGAGQRMVLKSKPLLLFLAFWAALPATFYLYMMITNWKNFWVVGEYRLFWIGYVTLYIFGALTAPLVSQRIEITPQGVTVRHWRRIQWVEFGGYSYPAQEPDDHSEGEILLHIAEHVQLTWVGPIKFLLRRVSPLKMRSKTISINADILDVQLAIVEQAIVENARLAGVILKVIPI